MFGEGRQIWGKYWANFKNQNEHFICSKKGKKYEPDRAAWSTYANFHQIYDQIYETIAKAGLAKELKIPTWKDKLSNIINDCNAARCKVIHDLIKPEIYFVMDKVGGENAKK